MDQIQPNGQARRRRQNPVSCQLCRLKKLKCDRQQPCSNCSARHVSCQPATRHPTRATATSESGQAFPAVENSELQARLEKLEDAVFGKHDGRPPASTTSVSMSHMPSAPAFIPSYNDNEEHEMTSKRLEGIGTLDNSIIPEHLNGIPLKVEPINQILADSPVMRNDAAPLPGSVQLPIKTEATSLFQYFLDNVQYLHPVIRSQSVEHTIDAVYADQAHSRPAHVALLLSIFASASHLWRPHRNKYLIFLSAKEAALMSSTWSNATLNVLEYSRRTTSASIEDLQATIIISYVIYNAQGFSSMFRSLHSSMIMMARDLSLHKTDSRERKKTDSQPSVIEDDIKRIIWWHIASTDWLLAFTPGPQEGTYSIQPSHMNVRYPQNHDNYDDANCALFSISYFHQRIRLSEICRAVVDSLPHFFEGIESVNYEQIISLDGKFEDLINNLPTFFQLNRESDLSYTVPELTIQRYLIHLGIYTRRSRLHQSFLVRGFTDLKYAFSRNACLSSSRSVLELCHMLQEKKDDLALIPARLGTVVHHVFMATVVLVMDLCSNKIEGHEEQRQEEVTRACRMLDGLKDDSTMAAKFLNPLMEILQKHKDGLHHQSIIPSKEPTDSRISQNTHDPSRDSHGCLPGIGQDTSATASVQQPGVGQLDACGDWGFDDMMQQYIDLGQNIDASTWDNLFADFDSYRTSDVGGAVFYG